MKAKDFDHNIDDRKAKDLPRIVDADYARLFAKWNLPEKFGYPDPVPAYQSVLLCRALV